MSEELTEQWTDILIEDRDLVLDVAGIPVTTANRGSIAQDIKHMFMDTGIAVELIGERNPAKWRQNQNRMERMVEEDRRIIPGTVFIDRPDHETIYITADTQLGPIDFYLPLLIGRTSTGKAS